jgi:hypothetical protein
VQFSIRLRYLSNADPVLQVRLCVCSASISVSNALSRRGVHALAQSDVSAISWRRVSGYAHVDVRGWSVNAASSSCDELVASCKGAISCLGFVFRSCQPRQKIPMNVESAKANLTDNSLAFIFGCINFIKFENAGSIWDETLNIVFYLPITGMRPKF